MRRALNAGFLLICIVSIAVSLSAQTKKPKKKVVTADATPAATPEATPQAPAEVPVKRNERPTSSDSAKTKTNNLTAAYKPVYFYQFDRPGFIYSQILIEHDEAGKGKISFLREGSSELLTDPIDLSDVTMTNIRQVLTALNFLDSTENYQYSRDFSNLGNIAFTLKKDGRERTVKYNWTDNKNAKILMDEYRRIGNEYTWRFEINVARENQSLQTPSLVDALDGYLQRSEISDPSHLLPFLEPLSNDERLPLIARNHAAKLIKQIEKAKK